MWVIKYIHYLYSSTSSSSSKSLRNFFAIDLLWFHSSDLAHIGNQGSDLHPEYAVLHLILRISFVWEIIKFSCVLIFAQPEISFLVVVIPHFFLSFQWHIFLATSNRAKKVTWFIPATSVVRFSGNYSVWLQNHQPNSFKVRFASCTISTTNWNSQKSFIGNTSKSRQKNSQPKFTQILK